MTFVELDMPAADPGGGPDPEQWGAWHKEVVPLLLEYGLVAAGLLRDKQPAWWSEERCLVCNCCSPRGGACWYCPTVNEEAA